MMINRKRFSKEFLEKVRFNYPCLCTDSDFREQFNFFLCRYYEDKLISFDSFIDWNISDREKRNLSSYYRSKEIDLKFLY